VKRAPLRLPGEELRRGSAPQPVLRYRPRAMQTAALPARLPCALLALPCLLFALAAGAEPLEAGPCSEPAPAVKFAPGEVLQYRLDIFGADVGSFELWLEPPPASAPKGSLIGHGRAKTSAFVSANAGRFEASSVAHVGPGLAPRRYREEVEDGPVRWVQEIPFPQQGTLEVKATRNGEPEPVSLPFEGTVRDLYSAFLLLRAAPLVEKTPLCLQTYAMRKLWRMAGEVGPKESIDTPLGRMETVRLDLVSTRLDDKSITRMAKFWVTADARRWPVAAIVEMRGKVFRAQLVKATAGGKAPR
jgi:Protein of unknown function (DUF3108)